MKKLKGFKYELRKHLADATSISFLSLPIKSITDQIAGISDINSIEARAKITALNYMGFVQMMRLRDYSKKKLGITKSPKKLFHYLHDIGFTLGICMPIQAGIYLSSGVDDWKKMATTLGISLGTLAVLSGPLGQAIDIYREITRVKKSRNTPKYFKKLNSSSRKKWATGLIVTSLALGGFLYSAIPNKNTRAQYKENSTLEKTIDEEPRIVYSEKTLEGNI